MAKHEVELPPGQGPGRGGVEADQVGIGGQHVYIPFWLYEQQKRGELDFARGYHFEIGGRFGIPPAAALPRVWGAGLKKAVRTASGATIGMTLRGRAATNPSGSLTTPVPTARLRTESRTDANVSPVVSPDGRYIAYFSSADLFGYALYIADARTGERLGNIALGYRDGVGDVSYWLATDARGRGVATRALTILSDWAAPTFGLTEIRLWTHVDNHASRKVIEANGGVLEDQRGAKLRFRVPTG